ncbi:Peptidase C14, caspase catalytic domain protein, partial [Candidatus Magnetomorum sp. HK-1]
IKGLGNKSNENRSYKTQTDPSKHFTISLKKKKYKNRGIGVVANPLKGNLQYIQLYDYTVALIIGIDEYINLGSEHYLNYAIKDAKGIETVLKDKFQFDEIITLYNEEATRDKIMKAFYSLRSISPNGGVLVYFAGHGVTIRGNDGKELGFFVPFDGSLDEKELYKNISMQQIKTDISRYIPAKHIFFIFDACFAGLMLDTRATLINPTRDLNYLQSITKEIARQILTAGEKGQSVLDGGPGNHSVFTGRLIESLSNVKDYITARELGHYLKKRVYGDAALRGHEQRPVDGEIYGTGDFVFVLKPIDLEDKILSNEKEIEYLQQLTTDLAEYKRKEAEEITTQELKLKDLNAKIESLRKNIGGVIKGDNNLDNMLIMIHQKEEQEKRLIALRQQQYKEQKRHQTEIDRLKSYRTQKIKKILIPEVKKFIQITSSKYGQDMKTEAWNSLIGRCPKNWANGVLEGDIEMLLSGPHSRDTIISRRQGVKYYLGTDKTKKNYSKAKEIFLAAAAKGDSMAKFWVARSLHIGRCGFEINKNMAKQMAKEVINHIIMLSDFGNLEAIFLMASAYDNGFAVEKNFFKVANFYKTLCNNNDFIFSCNNLGVMYEKGNGVVQDSKEAIRLYRIACNEEVERGCSNLGGMYERGRGISQDYKEAIKFYRIACNKKDPIGCNNLGLMYKKGRGVSQNHFEAFKFFQMSCDEGHSYGCHNVSKSYYLGEGVSQDKKEAVRIAITACNKGFADACYNVGVSYYKGIDVTKDKHKAGKYFRIACDKDDGKACNFLGFLYENGESVSQNKYEAKELYRKACDLGNKKGCENLEN